jgi:ribosomal protein S18 acetylase RimI-like enzyme
VSGAIAVRDARADEVGALALAVIAQPLLVRYGVTVEGLTRDLGAALARGDGLVVAVDGERRLGFAWFLPTGTFGGGGYLRLIALAPGAEGQGSGGALLDEVERRVAQTSRSLFLLVSHWNEGARRFYAARGYCEVGLLPAYVRADTDEVICVKKLRE